ncbi:RNA-guided endonuclease TnpB family protein [Paractinoplanes atraurantiacus]|uniref:Putative transposase n=1 Tax=Paractinoplanes atraurantiacus TaxID=1036182 RepID=A0A285JQD3_9ACTN|nr:RNA-guided endonuclease TnpB family protein [Actinoplanes atraurantiacus]SNY62525.1 putative transposase [Actinoplanes atraurantiacus]
MTWKPDSEKVLVSHTGHRLVRRTAFKFALDLTDEQESRCRQYAGAARLAYNHHIGRVKANLGQRAAELSYGMTATEMTPAVSWSKVAFINEMNAWKNGKAPDSPTSDGTGERGLLWRDSVCADVFECASVDAAESLGNWKSSKAGRRKGRKVGFPKFRAKRKDKPRFRLRSKSKPGETAPVRVTGPKRIRFSKLGEMRVHGCTKRLRRMITQGRFHVYSVSFSCEGGRWWASVEGVAAVFNRARRTARPMAGVVRWDKPAGLDRGVKDLAVIADVEGNVLHVESGVKALAAALTRLRAANKTLARTKPGSSGRAKAKQRLTRIHAWIAQLRAHSLHQLSWWLSHHLSALTMETLNITGMAGLRSLARRVADQAMGQLGTQIRYKADWYGLDLVDADRWYPSSKTCSGCGRIKRDLRLSERAYRCPIANGGCGLVLDRDVNAAINVARWPAKRPPQPIRAGA